MNGKNTYKLDTSVVLNDNQTRKAMIIIDENTSIAEAETPEYCVIIGVGGDITITTPYAEINKLIKKLRDEING